MGQDHSIIEDQLLVMDAQDGSREAMEQLVGRWQKRLWRHAFRLIQDSHAAWDISQTAWYDIVRHLGKLHDPAGFGAWAYKITTCRAIDWIKKKYRMRLIPIESMDTLAAKAKTATGVDELIGLLDLDKRVVLSLYYFEELSIPEISEVLKIPTGTVKSRLFTARNELKRLWEKASQ